MIKPSFAVALAAAAAFLLLRPRLANRTIRRSARYISKHHANRKRKFCSTAECSISIRSGIAPRKGHSRMP